MLPTLHLNIERWKFNENYGVWVSTKGRFRNRDKAPLPVKIGENGYCLIRVDCTTCSFALAHRLVMLTWKPTSEAENLTVDHLDHNKRNNALDNLEWVSFSENQKRAKEDLISEKEKTKVEGATDFILRVNNAVDMTIEEFCKFFASAIKQANWTDEKVVQRLMNRPKKLFGVSIEYKEIPKQRRKIGF